jgi:hypothetical protein
MNVIVFEQGVLPAEERGFKTRANRIVLFLQAISFPTAEINFVVRSCAAELTKRFSLAEARSFLRIQSAKLGPMRRRRRQQADACPSVARAKSLSTL